MSEKKMALAYVTAKNLVTVTPDDAMRLTHVNIAFGLVHDNCTLNTCQLSNIAYIHTIRSWNPSLKFVLSVGGWGAGGFSEMAMTEEGRKELTRINELQEFYFSKMDLEHLRQMDDRFHDAIYALCGSTVIRDTLRPLHRKTQRYRKASIENPQRLAKSIEEHNAIFAAIMSGDAELADRLITEHIGKAEKNMVERFGYYG